MKDTVNPKKRVVVALVVMLLVCLSFGPATATGFSGSASRKAKQVADWESVEPFFDEIVGIQLAEHHVAGAVVALVRDGEIVLAKGYGEANVEQHVRVDAEKLLFRIASLTKLFTWTAVMQLVEHGRLDLDADVNDYLDFEIPATYAEPVTLKDLMSHSAGLEERTLGIFVPAPMYLKPALQWLRENLPARVRPPGAAVGFTWFLSFWRLLGRA